MKLVGLAIVSAFMCIAVGAQHTVVTEADYHTACGKAVPIPTLAGAEKYRITIETKSGVEGRPSTDYVGRSVANYEGRSKWYMVKETTFGTTKKVAEEIHVDGKTYEKEGSGTWIAKVPRTFAGFGDPAKTETRYLKIEYRLLPGESYRGRMVRVCEKYELVSVRYASDTGPMQRESTSRYWISNEGLLKSENSFRNVGEKSTSTSWVRTEWEIDSTISVNLPAGIPLL